MSITKESPFRMGWLLVMFDLPVSSKRQRREATGFRKRLLEDGYMMVQFSIYARSCASHERMEKHTARLENFVPHAGNVRVLFLTDKQWSRGLCICGDNYPQKSHANNLNPPKQIEFW